MEKLDLIIVGAGPAGITSAIYANRYKLNFKIFEKYAPGGQVLTAHIIENYPGYSQILGSDLVIKYNEQLEHLGINIDYEEVSNINLLNDGSFEVITNLGRYFADNVILGLGIVSRKLEIEGTDGLQNISYCATCDGPLYKNKNVTLMGGGNSAIKNALYLAEIVNHLTIVQRSIIKANAADVERLKSLQNVTILEHTSIKSVESSNNLLTKLHLINTETNEESDLETDGLFVFIGGGASTNFLSKFNVLDQNGYIKVNQDFETIVPHLYGVGDCINKKVRQIVTAENDGLIAVYNIKTNKINNK